MRLSIIVPATGQQADLDSTLVSVLENRPENAEILVPHSAEYQDPYDLSDEVRFVASPSDQQLGLYNAGIRASQGEIVHLLRSGMMVTPQWTQPIIERLDSESNVAAIASTIEVHGKLRVGGLRYQSGGTAKVVPAQRRRTTTIDGPCLEAGFFRQTTLAALGPFDEELCDYFANADTAAKLRRAGLKCVHESDCVVVGAITPRPRGYRSSHRLERVYHRHRRASGPTRATLHHFVAMAANVTRHGPTSGLVSSFFGHCIGSIRSRLSHDTPWDPPASAGNGPATIRFAPNDEIETGTGVQPYRSTA